MTHGGYGERKRTIWANGNFQNWGEYIQDIAKNTHATEQLHREKTESGTTLRRTKTSQKGNPSNSNTLGK